jgi:hypothetical protein
MKKNVGSLLAGLLVFVTAFSQHENTQQPTLGIFFFFNDFKTAADIRATSLGTVLRNGQFGHLRDMAPGLAITYITGYSNNIDFTSTLTGAFLDYIKHDGTYLGKEKLLLEGDVSIKAKLFSNRYWVSPFMLLGAGVSKYRKYWGSFVPLGTGFQVNIFEEAFLIFNAQYRFAVTNTTSNHFFYSVGLAGNIARKRTPNGSVLPDN